MGFLLDSSFPFESLHYAVATIMLCAAGEYVQYWLEQEAENYTEKVSIQIRTYVLYHRSRRILSTFLIVDISMIILFIYKSIFVYSETTLLIFIYMLTPDFEPC